MIVTCPACETRYAVDDAALGGADGRRVRCADCGNVWHYSPEGAAIQKAIAELTAEAGATAAGRTSGPRPTNPTSAPAMARPSIPLPRPAAPLSTETLRTEPRIEGQPHPAGPTAMARPSVQVELPAAARRRRTRIRGLLLTILAVGVVLLIIMARDRIMTMWPQTVPVFAAVRLAQLPGSGLDVTVTPTRTSDSLLIAGSIVNTAATARRVPRMRVTLQDGNKIDIDSKVIDPPVEMLPPGAMARFNTIFERPNITATEVAVTFVPQ